MTKREDAAAVLIDFQDRLAPAVEERAETEAAIVKAVRGLRILGVPVIVTQQYTKGLGGTTPVVSEALGTHDYIEKNTFSCMRTPEFREALSQTGRRDVILMGIETHICVQQTALQLLEEGYRVFVLTDCCASRHTADHETSLIRLRDAGAVLTTTESVLYELMQDSGCAGFKEIVKLIK